MERTFIDQPGQIAAKVLGIEPRKPRKSERVAAPLKAFVDVVKQLATRHRPETIFETFVEKAALAISNRFDKQQYDEREKRFLEIEAPYSSDERKLFSELFAHLVLGLDEKPRDFFGEVWSALEMRGDWKGQFFSPYHLSEMMASITFSDVKSVIEKEGFITVCDPACGPGGLLIAAAHELQNQEINFQQRMHVTAVDIDPRCAHMAYLQLSLYGIPAIVQAADSLRLTGGPVWYTPMHVIGDWTQRLKLRRVVQDMMALMQGKPAAPDFQLTAPDEATVRHAAE